MRTEAQFWEWLEDADTANMLKLAERVGPIVNQTLSNVVNFVTSRMGAKAVQGRPITNVIVKGTK